MLVDKQAFYRSLSEYHMAEHEKKENNVGECLARLNRSAEVIKMAEQRGGKEIPLKEQSINLKNAYEKAKKENDFVYRERVPEYSSLKTLERVALARVTPLKFPISEDFKDLYPPFVPVPENNVGPILFLIFILILFYFIFFY